VPDNTWSPRRAAHQRYAPAGPASPHNLICTEMTITDTGLNVKRRTAMVFRRWRVRGELALWTAACGPAAVVCYRGGRTTSAAGMTWSISPHRRYPRHHYRAAPDDVWPWIVQIGYGRGGHYGDFRGGEIRKVIVVEPPVPM
jgi:hypothetical protein